ncbi:helix-turn-helix transcriptional regulator [Paracoccus mangrovi]|uniref:Helix-turn-helix transcriptional regulator n=1 Tax=Paracoccus mangrovi TaxID=1715645 RepID=A0ABV7R0K4_9RHOB
MPHSPSQPISAYLAAAPHARALGRLDLGFGRAATIWRNRDAHIRYDAPQGHVLSFYLRGGGGTRRVDPGVGRQPMRGWQGAFCLMPQGQSSEWDITDSFDFIHLYLPDEELRRAFAETFDRDARQLQLADLPYASAPRLSAPFLALAGAIRDGDPLGGETAMQALTVEILAAAGPYRLPVGHKLAGGLSPQKLRLIADYTEAHLDGPIRLRDLAALADLSEFHLQRSFRASSGVSPHRWVLHRRINRAKRLILAGEPLAQIATACGFDSQSHLTRGFRTATGVTPGQYRAAQAPLTQGTFS